MRVVLKGGLVADPLARSLEIGDVVVEEGRIVLVGPAAGRERGGSEEIVIDAAGKVVLPGLIDAHVHLREPGQEYKEDIASGTAAAALGGFTTVACMPNTDPVIDDRTGVEFLLKRSAETARVNVVPIGAVTKGQKGLELAEMGEMVSAGAVAFSDDGHPVENAEIMRCALDYGRMFGRPIIAHCEDLVLVNEGVMHQGYWSTVLGLRGSPAAAEEVPVARDLVLAAATGGRLHLTHLSTAGAMDLLRWAKERGIRVTADVTPHHLVLTDEAVRRLDYDPSTKVNPPLREARDVEALRAAVKAGLVDLIATDHAPHHFDDKDIEYNYAASGIAGLETAVALIITNLVAPGCLDWLDLARLMSLNPSRLLGLEKKGCLSAGADADITVIDPKAEWTVDPTEFASKGRNTPFGGMRLTGRITAAIVGGRPVVLDGKLV
jgi:dihydroorotase